MSTNGTPVPTEMSEHYPAADNSRRALIVSGVLFLWISGSLVVDFLHYLPRGERYYLYFDLTVLPLIAGFGLLSWKFSGSASRTRKAIFVFSLAFLVWAAVLATFQETPYTLFIVAFFVSTTLLIPPKESAVVYAGAFVAYAVASTLGRGNPLAADMTLFIEVLAMTITAGIVSLLLYLQRVQTLEAEEQLRRTNQSQEMDIANRTEDLNRRLREREVLLREIHHRVKNNMQIISSLLRLSGEYRKGKDAEELLRGAEQRIVSMAMVHQQLDYTDDFKNVDLAVYLTDLSEFVAASHRVGPEVRENDAHEGLGLVLMKSLSQQLGGIFTYDCSEGTTFRFELPLGQDWPHDAASGAPLTEH